MSPICAASNGIICDDWLRRSTGLGWTRCVFAGVLSPDGTRYASVRWKQSGKGAGGPKGAELAMFDVSSSREIRSIVPFSGAMVTLAAPPQVFSPNSNRFTYEAGFRDAAGRESWGLKVWDWETGREVARSPT